MLRPGVYEHEIVGRAHQLLFEMGSEQVEAVNAVSGDRCNPHPHVFSDRLLRPGDQAFFDIIHSFMGYRTCYYRTFNVGGVNHAQLDAYKQCREWLDAAIALVRPGMTTDRIAEVWPTAEELGFPDEETCFGLQFGHGIGVGLYESADDLARAFARPPRRDRGGDGLRARDVLRGDGRPLRGADRGGGRRHGDRLRGDHALPGRGAARRRPDLRARRGPASSDGGDGRATESPASRPQSPRPPWSSPPASRRERRHRNAARSPTACRRTASSAGRTSQLADALPGRSERPTSLPARRRLARLDAHGADAGLPRRAGTSTSTSTRSRRASTCWRASPVLYLDGRGVHAGAGRLRGRPGRSPARVPVERAGARGSRWRRRVPAWTGATRSSSARRPTAPPSALDVAGPAQPQPVPARRSGEMDLDVLKRGASVGAPTVSASMATAVLAYSGIAVKMLVDQRLDAQLHTMFMVDYQPEPARNPHDHPVRGVVLHARRRGRRRRGRRPLHAPARATSSGRPTGCVHAFYETQGGRVRWLETSAPGPPPRHSYRHRARLGLPRRAARRRTSVGAA